MKHLTIGIGLLVLLLGLGLLTLWHTVCLLDSAERPLAELPALFDTEDYEAILPLIEESRSLWEASRGYFSSIFSHAELEEVDQGYASLCAYAGREELAELQDAYTRLLDLLEHLRIMDAPLYYNILSRKL